MTDKKVLLDKLAQIDNQLIAANDRLTSPETDLRRLEQAVSSQDSESRATHMKEAHLTFRAANLAINDARKQLLDLIKDCAKS